MSTAMEQLHQLTHDELQKLSLNYGIAGSLVVNLDRRQLERRLHVAIISERARMRAHDKLYAEQYDQEDRESDSSVNDNDIDGKYYLYNDSNNRRKPLVRSRRADLTTWSYFNMRRHPNNTPTVSSRFRGGLDYDKEIACCSYAQDTESLVNSEEFEGLDDSDDCEDDDDEVDMKDMKDIEDDIRRQSSDIQSAKSNLSESIEATHSTIELQLSEQDGVSSHPDAEISESTTVSYSDNNRTEMRRDNVFNWLTDSNFDLTQESEPDFDPSSELVISTVNFLEDCQDDIGKPVSRTFSEHYDRSMNAQVVMCRPNQRSHARERHGFWRLIDMLLFKMQRKLNADKVQYSILCCCTIVVCTYLGFKIMK